MPWIPFQTYKPGRVPVDISEDPTADIAKEALIDACLSALADLKAGNLYGEAKGKLEFALSIAQRTRIP